MTLNQDQLKAEKAFHEFLLDPNMPEMVLTSPPGRGKTYLVNHLINDFEKLQRTTELATGSRAILDIALTATTNKAAKVLEENSNREVKTIHSFLGLKVVNNFSTGKSSLKKSRNYSIIYNTLIIIDEASMIDSPLREKIRESTVNCKILYVGDKNQLPPVKEQVPPVFEEGLPTIELHESMRFSGEIETLCNKLNDRVESSSFGEIPHIPGIIDYISREESQALIEELFSENNYTATSSKILTYSNDQAILYNEFIREEVWKLPDSISVNEYVLINSAVRDLNSITSIIPTDSIRQVSDIQDIEIWNEIPCRIVTFTEGESVRVPENLSQYKAVEKKWAQQKDWSMYFQIKEGIADLRPTFSSTVHKSQGSTYDNVIIDLIDVGSCRQPNVVTRLLNVALSRAKHRIYLIGDLPAKYKG